MWPFTAGPKPEPPPPPSPTSKIGLKNRSEAPLRCIIELWGHELTLAPESEVEIIAFGGEGCPVINVAHDHDRLTIYLETAERFELHYPSRVVEDAV